MQLVQLECPRCGARSADGQLFGYSHPVDIIGRPALEDRVCHSCQHRWSIPFDPDPRVLSPDHEDRWGAMSDHVEQGSVPVTIGSDTTVHFGRPFVVVGLLRTMVLFTVETPHGRMKGGSSLGPVDSWAVALADGSGLLLSATRTNYPSGLRIGGVPVTGDEGLDTEVKWTVYGLADPSALPTWHQLFYSAMRLTNDRLWRPAFLDYAAAFEAFVAGYLRAAIVSAYDEGLASYLLERVGGIEARVTHLMRQVAGFPFTEAGDLQRRWNEQVQKPRNAVSHGTRLDIGAEEVEQAHHIVYRAIRWIERHPVSPGARPLSPC